MPLHFFIAFHIIWRVGAQRIINGTERNLKRVSQSHMTVMQSWQSLKGDLRTDAWYVPCLSQFIRLTSEMFTYIYTVASEKWWGKVRSTLRQQGEKQSRRPKEISVHYTTNFSLPPSTLMTNKPCFPGCCVWGSGGRVNGEAWVGGVLRRVWESIIPLKRHAGPVGIVWD